MYVITLDTQRYGTERVSWQWQHITYTGWVGFPKGERYDDQ